MRPDGLPRPFTGTESDVTQLGVFAEEREAVEL